MQFKQKLLLLICVTFTYNIAAMELDVFEGDYVKKMSVMVKSLKDKMNFSSQIQIDIKEDNTCHKGAFENMEWSMFNPNKYTIVMDKTANQNFYNTIPFRLGKVFAKIENKEATKNLCALQVLNTGSLLVASLTSTSDISDTHFLASIAISGGGTAWLIKDAISGKNQYERRAIDIIESYEGVQDYYEMESFKSDVGYSIRRNSTLNSDKIKFLINYAKKRGYPYRRNNLLDQLTQPELLLLQDPEQQGVKELKKNAIEELGRLLTTNNISNFEIILSLYAKSTTLPGCFALRNNNDAFNKSISKNLEAIFGCSFKRDLQHELREQKGNEHYKNAKKLIKNCGMSSNFLEPIRIDYIWGKDVIIEEYTFINKFLNLNLQDQLQQLEKEMVELEEKYQSNQKLIGELVEKVKKSERLGFKLEKTFVKFQRAKIKLENKILRSQDTKKESLPIQQLQEKVELLQKKVDNLDKEYKSIKLAEQKLIEKEKKLKNLICRLEAKANLYQQLKNNF